MQNNFLYIQQKKAGKLYSRIKRKNLIWISLTVSLFLTTRGTLLMISLTPFSLLFSFRMEKVVYSVPFLSLFFFFVCVYVLKKRRCHTCESCSFVLLFDRRSLISYRVFKNKMCDCCICPFLPCQHIFVLFYTRIFIYLFFSSSLFLLLSKNFPFFFSSVDSNLYFFSER